MELLSILIVILIAVVMLFWSRIITGVIAFLFYALLVLLAVVFIGGVSLHQIIDLFTRLVMWAF